MSNKIAIIMAQWNRQFKFDTIINDLNNQTNKNFDFFVWNNSQDLSNISLLNEGIKKAVGYGCYLHNCEKNALGFGRFLLAKSLIENKITGFNGEEYNRIIFFDDDQGIDPMFVDYLSSFCKDKMIAGGWAFKIFDDTYSNRKRCETGECADYIGTCGCIMDSSLFKDSSFFDTYVYDKDVYWIEDVALTLYCKKINWEVVGIKQKHIHKIFQKGELGHRGQFKEHGGFNPKNKGYLKLKTHYLGSI